MKTIILILILFSSQCLPIIETNYCDGWKEGYKEGWCYEQENCIAPVAPVCPVPLVGETTKKDGYNRGFTQGKKDREKWEK